MIDDLATRVAFTTAAFVLLAAGFSVLSLTGGDAAKRGAQELADHLAEALGRIGELEGTATLRVGLDGAIPIPRDIAGGPYTIELGGHAVRVTAVNAIATAYLREPVHPATPAGDAWSAEFLLDLDASPLAVPPGGEFIVERVHGLVDGVAAYISFVHLPP